MVSLPKSVAVTNTEGALQPWIATASLIWRWVGKHKNNAQQSPELWGDQEQSEYGSSSFPCPKAAAPGCCSEPFMAHTLISCASCWNRSALKAPGELAGSKVPQSLFHHTHNCLSTELHCGRAGWAVSVAFSGAGQHSVLCHTQQPWAALISLNSPELKGICKGDLNLIWSLTQSCYFS